MGWDCFSPTASTSFFSDKVKAFILQNTVSLLQCGLTLVMGPGGILPKKNDKNDVIHRGSYTIAHVLFEFIKRVGERR